MARTRKAPAPPADESKADKFRRLANGRVKVALKAITGIGKLGTSAYDRTPDQIDALHKAITDAANGMRDKLKGSAKAAEIGDVL